MPPPAFRLEPRPTGPGGCIEVGLAACTLAVLAVLGSATPAWATHAGDELTGDQQVVQTADQLLAALRQYQALPAAQRSPMEARLAQLAQQRRDRLGQLLERNPRLAALRVLPPGLREQFPAAARAYLEQDVTLTGRVQAMVATDVARGYSRTEFQFRPAAGQPYTLYMADADAASAERALLRWSGQQVEVRGVAIGLRLLLADKAQGRMLASGSTATTTAPTLNAANSTPTVTPQVTGTRRTLAILMSFTDRAMSCSAADTSARLFGATGNSVNSVYRQSSRELVNFAGDVVGPYTIPFTAGGISELTGTCDYYGWVRAGEAAALAAGYDASKYDHVTYITPGGACLFTGFAAMPGRQSWLLSCGATGLMAHELGHNLGFHHAGTPGSEYADNSDPMGAAGIVRLNAANQTAAGWLPTGGVLDVGTSGTYTVAALGPEAGSATQVLRIAKPDTNEVYFVSMRQGNGVDANLPGYANLLNIHRSVGQLQQRTYLLKTLATGASFIDATNGVQVTHQGVSGNTATVAVTIGATSCERRAPSLLATPSSATAAAGAAVDYTVSVTNHNTLGCGNGSFTFRQVLPAGFSGSFSSPTVSVGPGATALTNWRVTSGVASAEATYTLDVSAGDGTGATTTAHTALVVVAADRAGPTLTVTNPAAGAVLSGRSVSFSATASDPSGVASVEFWVDGKLLARDTAAPYAANWNLRKVAKGVHTVRVRAIDTVGNVTELTFEVTVQ